MLYTEAISEVRDTLRRRLNRLPPAARAAAIRECSAADTHCWAWLRGRNKALSDEHVDDLMRAAGISLTVRVTVPRQHDVAGIANMLRRGRTLREVGERYGISHERVRQIAHEVGVEMAQRGGRRRILARFSQCPVCGVWFEQRGTNPADRTYCSAQCRGAARSAPWSDVESDWQIQCATCGKWFRPTNQQLTRAEYYGRERKYCSQPCYRDRAKAAQ